METTISTVSTETFAQRAEDPAHNILDVRPMAAYNGWQLHGEPRSGHVPGAKSIPFQWTQFMDWVEVPEEKQLRPDAPLTLYGWDPETAEEMADNFQRLGFEDVSIYDRFRDEWAADPERPLRRLERYQQLVPPEWLKALIDGDEPAGVRGDNVVICHAHFDHKAVYDEGHVPGAIPLNTNLLESPETWNRRSPDALKATLEDLGIRHDTTVVLYGRFSYPTYEQEHPAQSAGHLGAMRCAAIMLYAGVEDVKILNGGLNTWEGMGYEISTEDVAPEPVDDFGVDVPAHPEYMIDLPEAKELLAADDGDLVSVRSWAEFIGERSGYHYIEAKGRIPGAVFGNCGSDAYHMENYRNFDYTTREFPEIEQKWAEMGITPDKHIAFYCGTGWRGSEAFMNAYLMGWPNISVYDGGWFEWSNHPDLPTATGTPE
ncbi:MAG TPA: rhodanese-like domain-containing protein [Salinibacter sp.]|nr:rhodanese-like domain-containing protein [Salinibacter sp.]